jgi:hypothetical protein
MSLLPYLASKGLTCLNEDTNHALRSIVGSEAGPKGRNWLESDVDPEMLIALPVSDRPERVLLIPEDEKRGTCS